MAAGGRLWVFPALTAVVTTASGVAINVATDATASGLAWLAVVACTAAGAVLSALQLRRSGEPTDPDRGRSGAISIRTNENASVTYSDNRVQSPHWAGQLVVLTTVVVLLAASLIAVHTLGGAAPRDPTGAAPTIQAVTPQVSCGSDVVVPQPVSTMRTILRNAPEIAGASWPDWPPTRAGVGASPGLVRLDVQGANAAAVTIHDIRVRVVARRPATTGTLVSRVCGDAGAYRMLDVDLDRDPPAARSVVSDGVSLEDVRAGGEPDWSVAPIKFPYRVSLSEPESFVIYGNTASSDVSWVIDLDWASGRERGTATIDDGGTPFRTMGRASIRSSCTQTEQVWTCS